MGKESLFHFGERGIPFFVVVHEAVEPEGEGGGYEAATVDVGLEGTTGADTDNLEMAVRMGVPLAVFDSQGGVELGHDDVDVVAAHACGEGGEAGAVVGAGQGVDFAVGGFELNGFEDVFEHFDTRGVANEQHLVGQGVAVESYMV